MHIKIYQKIYMDIIMVTTYEHIQNIIHEITQINKPTEEFNPTTFLTEIKNYSSILSSVMMHDEQLSDYR